MKFARQQEKIIHLGSNIIINCFKFNSLKRPNQKSDISIVSITAKIRFYLTSFRKERKYNISHIFFLMKFSCVKPL